MLKQFGIYYFIMCFNIMRLSQKKLLNSISFTLILILVINEEIFYNNFNLCSFYVYNFKNKNFYLIL